MVSMFGSREWVDAGGLLSYGASLPGLYRRASGPLSQVCCEATARDAMMMNYKVFFITDANATLTDAEHGGTLSAMARTFCDVWVTQPAVPADRSDAGCDDQVAIRRTCIRLARYRGCGIRGKAATDSDGRRPPIPIESGHRIRTKAATLLIG